MFNVAQLAQNRKWLEDDEQEQWFPAACRTGPAPVSRVTLCLPGLSLLSHWHCHGSNLPSVSTIWPDVQEYVHPDHSQ